jgi:diacylglycerol kinase family enzyme
VAARAGGEHQPRRPPQPHDGARRALPGRRRPAGARRHPHRQRGTYRLNLGVVQRTFLIERGSLRFFGEPELNPTLDIVAVHVVRQSDRQVAADVEVRATIGGTLERPQLRLGGGFAGGENGIRLSESDAVSYLVTGAPSFAIGADQSSEVTAARLALSSLGSYLGDRAAGGLFDVVQFQTSGLGAGDTRDLRAGRSRHPRRHPPRPRQAALRPRLRHRERGALPARQRRRRLRVQRAGLRRVHRRQGGLPTRRRAESLGRPRAAVESALLQPADQRARLRADAAAVGVRPLPHVALLSRVGAGPVLLVVNPASRRGAGLRAAAHRAFARHGVALDDVATTAAGHAAAVAAERAADYAAVFTLGGDGTAMEVVGALAGTGRLLGILPGGTGNLVARTLGIPLRVGDAVDALLRGDEARIDLGRLASGQRFAFAAGVGADAYMIAHTPKPWKRRLGIVAYALTASRGLLLDRRPVPRPRHRGRRGPRALRDGGDGRQLRHGAQPHVPARPRHSAGRRTARPVHLRPETAEQTMRMMWRLNRRDFRDVPYMSWVPGREFTIETDPPQLAQADGELLGDGPLTVRVDPLAARLLVPATRAPRPWPAGGERRGVATPGDGP